MEPLHAFNLQRWIGENRHLLKPPVANKQIFRDSEFIVMVVGGPNARKDYHLDPAPELFYQLEGRMTLQTMQEGTPIALPMSAGDMLLLPPHVPHSPQRAAGSVGLVIERQRRAGELDGFRWYCERCHHPLHEEFFALTNIETQFPPVFARFFANADLRTCKRCGAVMEQPT